MKTTLKARVRLKAIEYRFKSMPPERIRKALTAGELHALPYQMGRVHFFSDELALQRLRTMVMQIIIYRAHKHGWQINRKTTQRFIDTFVELLVVDALFIYMSNEYEDTQRRPSGRGMAEMLGVDEGTWRRVWRPRFRLLSTQLDDSFNAMISHVTRHACPKNTAINR